MKKVICSVVLVATLVAMMSTSVLAGKTWKKSNDAYDFSSYYSTKTEYATVKSKQGCIIQVSFTVKTNVSGIKTCRGRLDGSKSVQSPWTLFKSFAKEGYVDGKVDWEVVTHTDK